MIRCERCGGEGPYVVIESHDYLDGADKDWNLCSECFIKFTHLMMKFIHRDSILVEGALGPYRP